MELPLGALDHSENEFFAYRYTSRFKKGDIVDIRTGLDLEVARFQARKSFPDVLNEYWWLKPSDIPTLKDIPLKVSDLYYYHGGVPVALLFTANGTLSRKAQIFLKRREEPKHSLESTVKESLAAANPSDLASLLTCNDLLVRMEAAKVLKDKYPDYTILSDDQNISFGIIDGDLNKVISYGASAVEQLVERFLVTTNAKETERIVDALIAIGEVAIPRLDDFAEFLSLMASPYYAKRINWTIKQIRKKSAAIKK